MIKNINNNWLMSILSYNGLKCNIPASVYSVFLENGLMENPFYGNNEYKAFELSKENCTFIKSFNINEEEIKYEKIILSFGCIDTVGKVFINDNYCFSCENMHNGYSFNIKKYLHTGENLIRVEISSPLEYIRERQERYNLWGVASTVDGFSHIRKPHYMFGWDWGPKLPDMGIYKSVDLHFINYGEIKDVEIRQIHKENNAILNVSYNLDVTDDKYLSRCLKGRITVKAPNGDTVFSCENDLNSKNQLKQISIENPCLWWPNGYGEQPLYSVTVELLINSEVISECTQKIGLRTLTVSLEKDKWGNEFCFVVNGVKIFAMGADYIPEDNILPHVTSERTEKLLRAAKETNFNCVRIWGGGHYATDFFMDLCDELGLIVWQDFMFACSTYMLTNKTEELLKIEFTDNIKRLRNHASLGILCGNNEMELAWLNWGIPQDYRLKQDYTTLFERILPEMTKSLCPDIFYWPASPSCGGGFMTPNDENKGDVHYWDVWIGAQPFESYDEHYFRFCSEFGFQAFPCMSTIRQFADEKDMNPFSDVMENHQKFPGKNERILTYMSQYYRYPFSFEKFVYISQMLQADAIESGVVHMRRNRGRCMGAVYWQLNDCWPVVSWSSIDYYGNFKALQYRAKEFFAKTLLSAKLKEDILIINVSHEGMDEFNGKAIISIKDNRFNSLYSKDLDLKIPKLSAVDILSIDISEYVKDKNSSYAALELYDNNGELLSSSSYLFVKPKSYNFEIPEITISKTDNQNVISVRADCYCKGVYLECKDIFFEKNFFDIVSDGEIYVPIKGNIKNLRAEDIKVITANY